MSLTGNSIQSTSLVNPGQQNESLGLNTVDPADTAGWVAGHLYWEYNPFPGNVTTSLELFVGRRDIQPGLANNDTQSVFTCMRDQGTGHLGTYAGDANAYGIGMSEADALGAAWADLRITETGLASRQCTLRLGGCLPNQAGSRSVLGPLLDTTNLAADDPNHIVVTVDPVDASNSTVTVYHNGVPGTPEVVSSSVFYGNTGSTLFGAVLGGTASPLNGYYFDNIAHYPLVLTSLQVATHYSLLANGGTVAVEGIREFQFIFSSADITHFEFYGVTLKTATGDDVFAGATQTVPVGSINYATMNPVSTGPASSHTGDYVVNFRTTADITAADLASYTIGSGTRYAYPSADAPAVSWELRYKNAAGAWVTLDTRSGETWPYIQTREFSIGGGSSTVNPAQFGFNFTGVPAPVVEIGTDGNEFDTGSLAPVVEFSTVGVPLKQQHTSGKWYFEVDMSDVVCDGSWVQPGLVIIGVEEKIGNQQGAMVSLSLQFDADGMVEKMIFWKKLKNAAPALWELSVARGEIPAYSMTSPQRVIAVYVDIGVSLPSKVRVAFGDKIGTSDGYWFDAMSGTFVPEGSTQLPVYWADQIPLQGIWTAIVNIRNVKAKVRVLTGESAPRISFDPGMKGWGLAS